MRLLTSAILAILMLGALPMDAQEFAASVDSSRSIARILDVPSAASGKCGTSDLMQARFRWNELSLQTQARIKKVLERPARQKTRLSNSGRFRIHYDTTGSNVPAILTTGTSPQRVQNSAEQFIDSVAVNFDYAWSLEVTTLGFLPPPSDGAQGGGPEYDVYVSELGSALFGQTLWNDQSDVIIDGTRKTFMSYIEIDNDFLGMRTPGLNGLRITAAHEFHHAIQVGNYGYWTNVPNYDFYFYELTSVWIEHITYSSIHDYYFDLPNYLARFRDNQNRSLSFATTSLQYPGYERSIWAQFLTKKFGNDVMRQVWVGIADAPVLSSTESVLHGLGTSLAEEFADFGLWNYFTADRAILGKYYDDAADWPRFVPNMTANFEGMTSSVSSAGLPLSTQFCQFAIRTDTLTAILTNIDAAGSVSSSGSTTGFQLTLSSTTLPPPYIRVSGGLWLSFAPKDKSLWGAMHVESSSRSLAAAVTDAFPNPVRLSLRHRLNLPVDGSSDKRAMLYFLNQALELMFSREYSVDASSGSRVVVIPSGDLRDALPSGIYFVRATCGGTNYQWKVAIIQ
jgi:hypothetical protein